MVLGQKWVRLFAGVAITLSVFVFTLDPAQAMKIQEVESPGGIKAWLVEEKSVPLISIHFGFDGGAGQDPENKAGLSYFLSGMLDEGAGDLTSSQFQERMEDLAVKLSFDAGRDVFSGNMRTLTENKDEAFDLLKMALTSPRFEKGAVDRVRSQIIAGLKFDENDPAKVASAAWFRTAFKRHPYGRRVKGNVESIGSITSEDLHALARRILARDSLKIAVVGDIDAKTLGGLLDKTFGDLPETGNLTTIQDAPPPTGPSMEVISMNVPQSAAAFGFAGLKRKDPDFIPAYVLNYIIGGGGFASRLTEEVREERGLAYSVYSYLYPYDHGAAYIGNVATRNKDMAQSLEVIRGVLKSIAEDGPAAEELANAKKYLTGSYALRFDTSSKISGSLLWIQIEDLGIDYIDTRNSKIEAVTLEELKRVARRLIKPDGLIVTIVGKPEGVSGSEKAQSGKES